MEMDFYLLNALHWGVSRVEAKMRLISFYCLNYATNPFAATQPEVLSFIHPDARAEVLAHYGIIVGEE